MEGYNLKKSKDSKIEITLTDIPRGQNPNLNNPVVLLGATLIDGNHKLRHAKENTAYTPDVLEINCVEDIVLYEDKLKNIKNNKWVTQLLEIIKSKIETDNQRNVFYRKLMYEKYGDKYDGWNDSSFITEELLNKAYQEEQFRELMFETKNNAGNEGKIII